MAIKLNQADMERIYQPKLVKVKRMQSIFFQDEFVSGKQMMETLGLKHKNPLYYAFRYGISVVFDKQGRRLYSLEDTMLAKLKREKEKAAKK